MFQVTAPQSSEDWQAYYKLRWQVLRAPWDQPRGILHNGLLVECKNRICTQSNIQ